MRISALSREYIHVPVAAITTNGNTVNPTTDSVYLAVIAAGSTPVSGDFLTADWATLTDGTTCARVLVGPGGSPSVGTFAAGFWDVWVKVTDSPEVPVIVAGMIEVY